MSYETLAGLGKLSEIDEVVEFFMSVNKLRLQGLGVRSFKETPQIVDAMREKLGMKEGEFKAHLHELVELLEEFSRRPKGESSDLIEELPEQCRAVVKKALARLVKAGGFGNEYGVKKYDWWIEKEIGASNGRPTDENIVRLEIKCNNKDQADKLSLRMDSSQFLKLHDSLAKLRDTTLTLLN